MRDRAAPSRFPRCAGILRRAACGALLLGLLAACSSDSKRLLEEAEARWRTGQYEDAIRLHTLLYERDRSSRTAAQALLSIGNIYYLNLRQLKDAIRTYNKLVEEFPGRPEELEARERLASIYENEVGDLTRAIHEYDKLLESGRLENPAEIQFQRANAYLKIEDFDRAMRELRRIEEAGMSGHFAHRVYLKIGNVYQLRNRFEESLEPFGKVAESPCIECRRRALIHLRESYESLYRFDAAIESIRKLDPTPENEQYIRREVERLKEKKRRLEGATAFSWTEAPRARR